MHRTLFPNYVITMFTFLTCIFNLSAMDHYDTWKKKAEECLIASYKEMGWLPNWWDSSLQEDIKDLSDSFTDEKLDKIAQKNYLINPYIESFSLHPSNQKSDWQKKLDVNIHILAALHLDGSHKKENPISNLKVQKSHNHVALIEQREDEKQIEYLFEDKALRLQVFRDKVKSWDDPTKYTALLRTQASEYNYDDLSASFLFQVLHYLTDAQTKIIKQEKTELGTKIGFYNTAFNKKFIISVDGHNNYESYFKYDSYVRGDKKIDPTRAQTLLHIIQRVFFK